MKDKEFLQTRKIIGPRKSVSKMTNDCYRVTNGEIVMYAADDIIFRTKNWDRKVRLAAHGKDKFLIYGNDLGQKKRSIATHGFVSRSIPMALGNLLTEKFEADFCDTWLTQVTKLSGCLYYQENLVIEHMHPDWKKASTDSTYLNRKSNSSFLRNWLKFQLMLPIRIMESIKIRRYKR